MWATLRISPRDVLDPSVPPEITDALERILQQRGAAASAASAPLPSSRQGDDEIIHQIELAEFGLPA